MFRYFLFLTPSLIAFVLLFSGKIGNFLKIWPDISSNVKIDKEKPIKFNTDQG